MRRLHVLIHGLPIESATWCAAAGHDARWSSTDHLIAALIDVTARANFKDPEPIPRPGEQTRKERALSERAARWRAKQAKRRG